jgi:class 3 adenylate cyclase
VLLAAGLALTGMTGAYLGAGARHIGQIQRAHETVRTTLASLELAHTETLLLDGLTQKINAGLELNQILDFVFESFDTLLPYERIGYALIEESSQLVRLRWLRSRSSRIRIPVGYAAPLRPSSLEQIVRSGVPRILNDLTAYLGAHPQSQATRLIVEEGMRSSLTCPLVVNDQPVGFLFFSSTRTHAYQAAHVEKFMRVTWQLSLIVQKGRCHDEVAQAHARLARLLDDMLPPVMQQRLATQKGAVADSLGEVTVLFADLVAFSTWSARLPPEQVVAVLNRVFTRFDSLAARYGVLKVGSQGDSYLAVAGAPSGRANHVEAAARLGLAMQHTLTKFAQSEQVPLAARIGIHTGPVIAGIIGRYVLRYDVWGQTVNLASRLEASGETGRIQVSEQVYQRLKSRFRFEDRGCVELKGFGTQQTYWLVGRSRARSALQTDPVARSSSS